MSSRWLLTACAAATAACAGGAEIRGASTLRNGRSPDGRQLALYVPTDCRDRSGAPAVRDSRVRLLERADGRRVIVEERRSHDSLVIENTFAEQGASVFQAVLESDDGKLVLHDFRLPPALTASGRVTSASRWKEVELPAGGFRAYPERPALSCVLAPTHMPATHRNSEPG